VIDPKLHARFGFDVFPDGSHLLEILIHLCLYLTDH
jgi:hypothetical protein